MKENKYVPFGREHREEIGKTVFTVNSFADSTAEKSSEELIIQLLKSKILNNNFREETV
ncbi:MAG: hypothetical protein NC452_21420 [Eubacterium sp.]|nr:hypothetical protein [Eubacterium sp.]